MAVDKFQDRRFEKEDWRQLFQAGEVVRGWYPLALMPPQLVLLVLEVCQG